MGRYDDEMFLTVAPDDFSTILTDPKLKYARVRRTGYYDRYEIRVNLVPYTLSGDLLLYKALHRTPERAITYTLEIPQRLVTIPEISDLPPIDKEMFQTILFNNLYIAIMADTEELDNFVRFDKNSLYSLIKRMGLRGEFQSTLWCHIDNYVLTTEHCIDVYMMVKIEYNDIQSDFIYLPTALFEQYCESKHPASYATVLGFYEDEYDENSRDVRMNQKGKNQIRAVIDWLRKKDIIR